MEKKQKKYKIANEELNKEKEELNKKLNEINNNKNILEKELN